ncbi:PQQ-dependent sugar dehydrogenase [Brevibacillus choshinensis]|uniref:PQQ-dependent sugar dehydrogenase n=1 Tax=Brevibacillus choshinensis TaxID=54911 RepID=UPI002E214B42|nr:PQQ-dependent sugar dehydrogenase [Brevibacillus choshinensis]
MWKKWVICLLVLVLMVPVAACGATDTKETAAQEIPYVTEVVADHLDVPWAIDMATDGRILFTERPGRVRVIQAGKLQAEPLIAFPAPFISEGEGGLLGLVLDPKFAENHYLYVYHTYMEGEKVYNRVLRLREENNRAQIDKVLIDKIPGSGIHNGGRLKIGPDQLLYITTGDARIPELAQDRASLAGKILRIQLDGSLPADNPFPGSPVFSWGHRNPQGIAWNPANGLLYSSEHGQSAHDEINRIQSGVNYGWPVIQGDQQKEGMATPIIHSGDTTWAPSGMTFVTKGPWAGQLLVANLRGMQVQKITLDPERPDTVVKATSFWQGENGRLRDVFESKDGSLYLLTNNRDGRGTPRDDDDKIIRLVPRQP